MRLTSLLSVALAAALLAPLPRARAMSCPTAIRGKLGAVSEGRRAWLEFNCSVCHGNAAAGAWGPNIQGAEAGDIGAAVLNGDAIEGGMPSFHGCATKTDVKNLSAYLRIVGSKTAPTWLDWWNPTP